MPQTKSLFSALSPLVFKHRRRPVQPVRRLCTPWRDWWPTILSSIQHASAASTATPNSAWALMLPYRVSSTASLTSSSCSRAKVTMMRALAANSTKSSGPARMVKAWPRHRNVTGSSETLPLPASTSVTPFYVEHAFCLSHTHTDRYACLAYHKNVSHGSFCNTPSHTHTLAHKHDRAGISPSRVFLFF